MTLKEISELIEKQEAELRELVERRNRLHRDEIEIFLKHEAILDLLIERLKRTSSQVDNPNYQEKKKKK